MTGTEQALSLVQRAYRCYAAGDMSGLMALVATDVDYFEPGPPGVIPWAGHFRGLDGFAQWLAANQEHLVGNRIEPETYMADGNRVVMLGRVSATVRKTGKPFESDVAMAFTVVDGRLHTIRVYHDTLPLLSAIG